MCLYRARSGAGGYLGIQGGIAHHDTFFDDSDASTGVGNSSLFDQRKTGAIGGGLLSYNWQQGSFIYGVEVDWNWIGARTARNFVVNFGNESVSSSFDVDWLATLRGRAGLAFDSTLVYVTGGVAFGHVKDSFEVKGANSADLASFTQNKTKVGWTAGVGVERMFSRHWTARAEFRYVDLGTTTVACSSATNFNQCVSLAYRGEFSNTLKLGLVGLAYKF